MLVAPFDAVVSRRHLDLGAVVPEGNPVYTLLEASGPEVRIGVAPDFAGALTVGSSARVDVRDRSLTGRVISLSPELDRRTRTAEVRLELDAALGDELRDGDAAAIELVVSREGRGVWLPMEALTQSVRGLWAIYVVAGGESDRRVERREVELLHMETDRALVRGPIEDGASLVVAGVNRIVPGVRVAPVPHVARAREEPDDVW